MRKLKNYEQCLFETYGLTADHVEAGNVLSSQPVLKAQDFSRVLQSLPQTRPGPKGVGSYPGFSCSQPKSTHLKLIKPVRPHPIKGPPFIGKGLKKGAWAWFWSHLFYPARHQFFLSQEGFL